MFILMASPVIKLCCSNRLLSSSLQLPALRTGYSIIGGRNGFVRAYASVNFVFLASRHCPSLLHICHLWTSAVKIEGVEGIRMLFGSDSRLLQVLALIRKSGILAPVQLLQSDYFSNQIRVCLFVLLRLPLIQNQLERR